MSTKKILRDKKEFLSTSDIPRQYKKTANPNDQTGTFRFTLKTC